MKLNLTSNVVKKYPHFSLVCLDITAMDNFSKLKESSHLLTELESYAALSFSRKALISPTTAARLEFKEKVAHYHTSLEKILKKVAKGKKYLAKNVLTNLCLYISLRQIIPLICEEKTAHVTLDFKNGHFIIYRGKNIIGRDFETKNKLNAKTTAAVVLIPIVLPLTSKMIKPVVAEATDLITTFCQAKIKAHTLNAKKRAIQL